MSDPNFAAHMIPGSSGRARMWMHHQDPESVIEAWTPDEVLPALHSVEAATENGLWAVGWIAYEASPAFDPTLEVPTPTATLPLLRFVLYRDARMGLPVRPQGSHTLSAFTPSLSEETFTDQVLQVKEAIALGETYQVNLTYGGSLSFEGDPWSWFRTLRGVRPGPYPFYLEEPDRVILSASPELFFHRRQDQLTCRPMKGTAHPGEEALLQASIKDRAENVMIVDMIRNDLGKRAQTGSVKTERLFQVESYPTVVQMTSTITAAGEGTCTDWMEALFPCASITGAPKRKTMSWIRKLEQAPRGIYTGCIGWISPQQEAEFNVAIRTAVLDRNTHEVNYHTGCGIVWDSHPQKEYAESLLKTRVLHQSPPDFQLIETMRVEAGQTLPHLPYHLRRLENSAAELGFELNLEEVCQQIHQTAAHWNEDGKLRVLLSANGTVELSVTEFPDPEGLHTFRVDTKKTPSHHPELRHKTTRRGLYSNARKRCPDADETLLINERDELMEFSIGNLMLEQNGAFLTPPLSSGGLSGVYRQWLIDTGMLREQVLTLEDLDGADRVYLINSVRGKVPLRRIS